MATTTPIYLPPHWHISEAQFLSLVQANPDVRWELTAQRAVIAMPPTGGETGHRKANLLIHIGNWHQRTNLGIVFDSSSDFRLPNGAICSPDI